MATRGRGRALSRKPRASSVLGQRLLAILFVSDVATPSTSWRGRAATDDERGQLSTCLGPFSQFQSPYSAAPGAPSICIPPNAD